MGSFFLGSLSAVFLFLFSLTFGSKIVFFFYVSLIICNEQLKHLKRDPLGYYVSLLYVICLSKLVTTKTAAVHLSEYKTIPELFLIFSRPVLISDGITLRRHLNELKVASSSSSSCKCLGASCYFPRDSFLFPVPFSTEFCREVEI